MSFSQDVINLMEAPKSEMVDIENLEDNTEDKKANFQKLFSKYIDNRIILVVTEALFPH